MVVDDDEDVREALYEVLVETGHRALEADGGEVALRMLRSGTRPDLLLVDLNMPGLDGQGLRQRMLDDPELAGIPVVFLTASRPRPGSLPEGVALATKPISVDDLVTLIARHVTAR
jgi:CheY-like chemotaxis protein